MQEEIIRFGPHASLVGVLTSAEKSVQKDLCVVISNSGLIHKPGPNRLSVKLSRHLAELGISSFRFDFSGTGDSGAPGEAKDTVSACTEEIRLAMNKVSAVTGISRFALYGLCSGATLSFRASLEDERVHQLVLVDGEYSRGEIPDWLYPASFRRCAVRYYRKSLLSPRKWIKMLSGKSKVLSLANFRSAFAMIASRLRSRTARRGQANSPAANSQAAAGPAIDNWQRLLDRGVQINLVFSEGAHFVDLFNMTLYPQLKRQARGGNPRIKCIKDTDHTFTPVWSQELLTDLIGKWVAGKPGR